MLGPTCRHKLLPNRHRKRKVRKAASVEVAELTAPNRELETAEAMGCRTHAVPRRHFSCNLGRK